MSRNLLYVLLGLGVGLSVWALVDGSIWTGADAGGADETPLEEGRALDELPPIEPPVTPVAVEEIRRHDLVQRITSSGVFRAHRETDLVARVSGPVIRLAVDEGSFVREGDLVLEIDPEPYEIACLLARDVVTRSAREYASVALLSRQLQRTGRVRDEIASAADTADRNDRTALRLFAEYAPKEWIASTTGLTRARLDLRRAELDLGHTVIRAPFDAYVTGLEATLNGTISQGRELMRLVAPDPLLLEVGILESELRLVQAGAEVSIRPHAFPGERFTGVIAAVSPVVDPQSGTCDVRIRIDNPGHRIKPGMFAQVAVETRLFVRRLLVPRDAVLVRDDRKLLFVREGGLAKWRYVKTGLENDDFIEITEGVSEGEELIVAGHFNLAHDAKIVVVQD